MLHNTGVLGVATARASAQAPNPVALFAPGSNGGISGRLPLGTVAGLGAAALLAAASAAVVLGRRR